LALVSNVVSMGGGPSGGDEGETPCCRLTRSPPHLKRMHPVGAHPRPAIPMSAPPSIRWPRDDNGQGPPDTEDRARITRLHPSGCAARRVGGPHGAGRGHARNRGWCEPASGRDAGDGRGRSERRGQPVA